MLHAVSFWSRGLSAIFQHGGTVVESVIVDTEKKPIGPIDALTSGFVLIARRPWAMLLPVMIYLFTWLGPRLSIAPLVRQAVDALQATAAVQTGQYAEWVQSQAKSLAALGDQTNLFDLLAVGVPGLIVTPKGPVVWSLDNGPVATALAVAILVIGVFLLALYLLMIAQQVRDDRIALGAAIGRTAPVVWRLGVLGVVVLGILTLVSLPALLGIGLLSLFSAQGAAMLSSLLIWGCVSVMFWLLFYLYFVMHAIVLDNTGLRQGVSRSVVLVRQNSGSTLGLILLTLLLGLGLGQVWGAIAETTLGAVAGILGSAYIATGLVAASLIFYRSRWSILQKQLNTVAAAKLAQAALPEQTDQADK